MPSAGELGGYIDLDHTRFAGPVAGQSSSWWTDQDFFIICAPGDTPAILLRGSKGLTGGTLDGKPVLVLGVAWIDEGPLGARIEADEHIWELTERLHNGKGRALSSKHLPALVKFLKRGT